MKSIKILTLLVAFFIVQPMLAQEELYRWNTLKWDLTPVLKCQKWEYIHNEVCLKKISNVEPWNYFQSHVYGDVLYKSPSQNAKPQKSLLFWELVMVVTEKNWFYYVIWKNKKWWVKNWNITAVKSKWLTQLLPDIDWNPVFFSPYDQCIIFHERQNFFEINEWYCVPSLANKKSAQENIFQYGETKVQWTEVYSFPNQESSEVKNFIEWETLVTIHLAIEDLWWYWVSWWSVLDKSQYWWIVSDSINLIN
jgi:hypothetical protein